MNPANPIFDKAFGASVLESIEDAIVVVDDTQIIRYCNAAAEELFGFQRSDLEGRTFTVLLPKRHRQRNLQRVKQFQQSLNLGRKCPSLSGLHSSGAEFPISVSVAALTWHESLWSVGVIRDASDFKNSVAVQELRREYEQLELSAGSLLDEIKLLRSQDKQTEERLNQLSKVIAGASSKPSSGTSLQEWFRRMAVWQRIIAALAIGVIMLSEGVPLITVLDQVIEQIGLPEQGLVHSPPAPSDAP